MKFKPQAVSYLVLAGVLLGLQIMAFFDPIGTKMADDGDPFGTAVQPVWLRIFIAVIILLLFIRSICLMRQK